MPLKPIMSKQVLCGLCADRHETIDHISKEAQKE